MDHFKKPRDMRPEAAVKSLVEGDGVPLGFLNDQGAHEAKKAVVVSASSKYRRRSGSLARSNSASDSRLDIRCCEIGCISSVQRVSPHRYRSNPSLISLSMSRAFSLMTSS